MSKALDNVIIFKRDIIHQLLKECSLEQANLFGRLFGEIDAIPERCLDNAITLCERTVSKNLKTCRNV